MPTADYFTITLPTDRATESVDPALVLPTAPKRQREHVETFARYFLRERGQGALQFEAAETPSSVGYVRYEAHLFHDEGRYCGACCFRWRDWADAPPSWSLDWIWLHPYRRQRGLLTRAWPKFKERYGDFHLAQPLSAAMRAFLRKTRTPGA